MLNDFGILSYASPGGVLSSMIVTVCVFYVGTTKGVEFHGKGRLFNLNGIPIPLSLYTLCYGAHPVFPPIYNSIRNKSQFLKVRFCVFYSYSLVKLISKSTKKQIIVACSENQIILCDISVKD